MSETKWTPGPWGVEPTTLAICRLIVTVEDVNCDEISATGHTVAYVPTDYMPDQQHANARLIAAAPELFEACEAIEYEADRESGHDIIVSKIRFAKVLAALAKARGEVA